MKRERERKRTGESERGDGWENRSGEVTGKGKGERKDERKDNGEEGEERENRRGKKKRKGETERG